MKVLVVDDSLQVVSRLVQMLEDCPGVEIVGQAGNGTEAMNCVHCLHPDAVVLDLQMPGGATGMDVLKEIKLQRAETLVIVLTNYGLPQYRKACLAAGADFFFDKSREFEKVGPTLSRTGGGVK